MERVKGELNPHYDDAHEIVNKMIKKFDGKVPSLMQLVWMKFML